MKRKRTSYRTGLFAENLAALLLFAKGYRIVARRFKCHYGEVDIIAVKSRTLVGVEVKARRSEEEGKEAILIRQRERIERTLLSFAEARKRYAQYQMRFDAIVVAPHRLPLHIKDAWNPKA